MVLKWLKDSKLRSDKAQLTVSKYYLNWALPELTGLPTPESRVTLSHCFHIVFRRRYRENPTYPRT
jgi:hypothetical protein